MKENDKTHQPGPQPGFDLMLARAVRQLDPELQPRRDLWPGIERGIADHPQRQHPQWFSHWLALGVAASLVMAASALTLSLVDLNQPGAQVVSTGQAIEEMQMDYLRVRNPMLVRFSETNKHLAPETLNELYRNLEILAQARRDIEAQVRKNPQDGRLVEKLMDIHEQELDLMKQDYLANSRSM